MGALLSSSSSYPQPISTKIHKYGDFDLLPLACISGWRVAISMRFEIVETDSSELTVDTKQSFSKLTYGGFPSGFVLPAKLFDEKQPERPWPKDRIWVFKSSQRIIGSPMLDSVLNKCPLDKEMMQWLKSRPAIYNG